MHSSQQARSSKVLSLFVALALAFGMVGFVSLATPSNAYADENSGVAAQSDTAATSGTIGVQTVNVPVQVEAGTSTVNLSNDFSWSANGVAHVDYMVTSGKQYATVNKHTGIVTGLQVTPANQPVVVTAYVIPGPPKTGGQQTPNTLCSQVVLSKASIDVAVTPTTTYGFQGTDNAVKMITPDVTSYSGSVAEGYTNITEPVANEGGYYYFTFQTSAGFRTYNTPEKYAAYNYDQITAVSSDGFEYDLNAQNAGEVTISNVDVTNQQITVKVDASAIGDKGQLVIHKDLKANNRDRIVGAELTFDFTAAK